MKHSRAIARARAYSCVVWYLCVCDVTARSFRKRRLQAEARDHEHKGAQSRADKDAAGSAGRTRAAELRGKPPAACVWPPVTGAAYMCCMFYCNQVAVKLNSS